jgi:hypothetical protein
MLISNSAGHQYVKARPDTTVIFGKSTRVDGKASFIIHPCDFYRNHMGITPSLARRDTLVITSL